MGLTRVELVTSRLSGVRSNQLSYRPLQIEIGKERYLRAERPNRQFFEAADVAASDLS